MKYSKNNRNAFDEAYEKNRRKNIVAGILLLLAIIAVFMVLLELGGSVCWGPIRPLSSI